MCEQSQGRLLYSIEQVFRIGNEVSGRDYSGWFRMDALQMDAFLEGQNIVLSVYIL